MGIQCSTSPYWTNDQVEVCWRCHLFRIRIKSKVLTDVIFKDPTALFANVKLLTLLFWHNFRLGCGGYKYLLISSRGRGSPLHNSHSPTSGRKVAIRCLHGPDFREQPPWDQSSIFGSLRDSRWAMGGTQQRCTFCPHPTPTENFTQKVTNIGCSSFSTFTPLWNETSFKTRSQVSSNRTKLSVGPYCVSICN